MTSTIWFIFLATALFTIGFKLLKFEKGNKQGDTTIYARDIIAFTFIALSFLGAFLGSQTFQAEAAGGGGALATYRCPDFMNLLCYGPGTSGITDGIPQGTWENMPPNTTELLGNTSYRQAIRFDGAEVGYEVSLTVGCLVPSNHFNATLILQYANVSSTTNTNSSNFVNIPNAAGGHTLQQLRIDNPTNFPCPGVLTTPFQPMFGMQANPTIVMFRVVGVNGGGSGDNPRFSSVGFEIQQYQTIILSVEGAGNLAGTGATYTVFSLVNEPMSVVAKVNWYATNVTGSGSNKFCGSGDICFQSNQDSCTINAGQRQCSNAITYPVSFGFASPAWPFLITVASGSENVVAIAPSYYPLLQAQNIVT